MGKKKKKEKPKKRSKKIRLKIEDLNEKGDGIAFYKHLKISVKKTLPGEEVLVEYLPNRPRKDRIQLLKILDKSPFRTEPLCPYFEECGGCHLQHIAYAEQLELKKKWIERLLLAYPALKHIHVQPVEGMPEARNYRNKTQMPFQNNLAGLVYGLYRKGTHEVTPIDYCLVETRDANRALQIIKNWAEIHNIPAYNEATHSGIIRYALIRKGQFSNQVMVVIISNQSELPYWKSLVQKLKEGLPSLKSVILNVNQEKSNVVLGKENIVLWGEPFIEEKLGRIRFIIYPNTFFQSNSVQTVRLLEKLVQQAELKNTDKVLDLYCGVGTIGLYVTNQVAQVLGIDNNVDAIAAARENAVKNALKNINFLTVDLTRGFEEIDKINFEPNIIIVDPPRKGLTPELIQDICNLTPEKLIYISCNPRTLVRDLYAFQMKGYFTEEIFPFDMFPHTSHIECLTILNRRG